MKHDRWQPAWTGSEETIQTKRGVCEWTDQAGLHRRSSRQVSLPFSFFFWGPTEGFYLLTCEGSAGSCKTPTVWTYIGLSSIIQHLAHCGWTTEASVCVWVCVCFHCSESTLVRFFQKITQYLRMTFCCFMSAVFDGNLFYDLTSAPLLNSWRVPELKWQVFASL